MKHIFRSVLVAAALLVAVPTIAVAEEILCNLSGMEGGCCLGRIQNALMKIDGVEKVTLDPKDGKVALAVREGVAVSEDAIRKAVVEADDKHNHGFKVTGIAHTP